MPEKQNATTQYPKIFYARHMQAGICRYEDKVWLADVDAIKSMMPTAIGMPVYIHHDNGNKESRLKNLKEEAAGYITESFYNELDGWFWFKFIAVDDKAHKAISQGWSVSNAYIPTSVAGGGTKNNCPYDSEVKSGEFTHLAIVPNPRYEEACIMSPDEFRVYQEEKKQQLKELQNSKTEGSPMFFRNKKEPVSATDTGLKDEEVFTEIKNDDGSVSVVSMAELKNAKITEKKNAEKKNIVEDDDDMMEDCDGEKVSRKDLKNSWKAMKANEKKNAEEKEEEAKKKKEAEEKANKKGEKKNGDGDESKKDKDKKEDDKKEEDDEEKQNARHFEELRNAHTKKPVEKQVIQVPQTKLALGKARYSLNK